MSNIPKNASTSSEAESSTSSSKAHQRHPPNPTITDLSNNLATTSLSSVPLSSNPTSESTLATPTTTSSTYASTTSIASLSSSDPIVESVPGTSPGTGMTGPQDEEGVRMEDAVARYKQGLYAYTVSRALLDSEWS